MPWYSISSTALPEATQAPREPSRIAGADRGVPGAVRQQHGRRAGRDVLDRLRRHLAGAAENVDQHRIVERQEVVGPGQTDDAADRGGRKVHRFQIARIHRQHRGDIGAGGMAADDDAVRIAALRARPFAQEAKGQRAVLDEGGVFDLRIEPVIGDRGDDALAGEGLAQGAVDRLGAALPASAIEEQQDRRRRLQPVGDVEVEPLAGIRAIGEVGQHPIARARQPGC
ncbi:MAG: hypothetical protein WDM86_12890 [Rhizomicrobium sp.]